MNITVLGAGGTGGYFGALLSRAGHDVTFIARGPHLERIRQDGLQIESPDGAFRVAARATDDVRSVEPPDLVLFCVKTYQAPEAIPLLPSLIGPETYVLPLQNGVVTVDEIAGVVGDAHTLGGAAYIEAAIARPGVVMKSGPLQRIVLGTLDGTVPDRVRYLHQALQESGIDAQIPPDIRVAMWSKFVLICAMSGLTTLTQLAIGPVLALAETRQLFADLVRETAEAGRLAGVPLPEDIVEKTAEFAGRLPPTMQSSMQKDLSQGRPLELDALNGAVVRIGFQHGVDMPISRTVYGAIKLLATQRD